MRSADFMMIMLTLMLVIFGIIMVFSASYYWSINQFGQPYHFLIRDLFWAVTGFGWMFAAMIIDYHVLANKKIAVGAMIVSIILLALVLTPLAFSLSQHQGLFQCTWLLTHIFPNFFILTNLVEER